MGVDVTPSSTAIEPPRDIQQSMSSRCGPSVRGLQSLTRSRKASGSLEAKGSRVTGPESEGERMPPFCARRACPRPACHGRG